MLGFVRRTRALEAHRAQLRTIILYASNWCSFSISISKKANSHSRRKEKKKKTDAIISTVAAPRYPPRLKSIQPSFCRLGIFTPTSMNLELSPAPKVIRPARNPSPADIAL